LTIAVVSDKIIVNPNRQIDVYRCVATARREASESFGQAFSKACAVKGAEPLSPSAEGEITRGVSFLLSFFLCASCAKEKSEC
jgi:hypothetical protein